MAQDIYESIIKGILERCIQIGDYTLHSGNKSKYLFDALKCLDLFPYLANKIIQNRIGFVIGIEFGGALLAASSKRAYGVIRKDGSIYPDLNSITTKSIILLDDVVTTGNSMNKAREQINGLGLDIIFEGCILNRGEYKCLSLIDKQEWEEYLSKTYGWKEHA